MTRIVIIGAGHAGVQLADSLREEGHDGEILLISDELDFPYQRPPLTKEFLSVPEGAQALPHRARDFFVTRNIELRLGARVSEILPEVSTIIFNDRSRLTYDHLVIATGSRPRRHPLVPEATAHSIRTITESRRFGAQLKQASSLLILGSGFIALEVASAARLHGVAVTIASPRLPIARIASAPISEHLLDVHQNRGCEFIFGTLTEYVPRAKSGGVAAIGDREVAADIVLVGIGGVPNVELGKAAGLQVCCGLTVDEWLRTSEENIWAIGDVAERHGVDGTCHREESVQAATHQARCLAQTLTGTPTRPTEVPWFWSNQGDLRLQIAGSKNVQARSVVRGSPASGKFSVFNFVEGRLCDVESINSPADHLAARRLLASGAPLTPNQASDLQFDLKSYSKDAQYAGA